MHAERSLFFLGHAPMLFGGLRKTCFREGAPGLSLFLQPVTSTGSAPASSAARCLRSLVAQSAISRCVLVLFRLGPGGLVFAHG
jgi:hypothetical protein